jgi:protein TonB
VASLLMQCLFVAGAIVAPLVYGYDPPVDDWVLHSFLLAPPPPPQVAPQPAPEAAAPVVVRFAALAAPASLPEHGALLPDAERASLASLRVPGLGAMPGGPAGLQDGVLGAAGVMQAKLSLPPKPLRIGGKVQAAKIIARVSPVYPIEAIEKGISGPVHLEAIITTAGVIREIKVLSGDPLLVASALDAVRQWRYRPTYLNGQPVEVITQIEVVFHITPDPIDTAARNITKDRRQGPNARKDRKN